MDRGDPIKDLDLENFLPFLLNRAGTRIAGAFAKDLNAHGVDIQMWRVLAALHQEDGQRMGDLAALTSIEISTLSRLIGRMEDANLVERRREIGDMRGVSVHITHKGEGLTGAIIPFALDYETVALQGFDESEARSLKAMLRRVFANMSDLDDVEPA